MATRTPKRHPAKTTAASRYRVHYRYATEKYERVSEIFYRRDGAEVCAHNLRKYASIVDVRIAVI